MPKSTSLDEVTSNNERIKPVALAVIELCCFKAFVSQSVSQSVSQLVSRSVSQSVENSTS